MDPLSQVSLGAAAAALASNDQSIRRALVVGAIAGGLPDLDVLISSSKDPLISLKFHRHFTHALLFAPVIGLLVAISAKYLFYSRRWALKELFVFATLGAISHGLLDACTSYGTMLYLPLNSHRESWDLISIIDPIFTLPLVMLIGLAFIRKYANFAKAGLILCASYLLFGFVQRERATSYAYELAELRGVDVESVTARPSFANTILWRLVVEDNRHYYVDAVWLMPFFNPTLYEGSQVERIDTKQLVEAASTQANDIQRFNHFSQGYLYLAPNHQQVLGDLRYSLFPDSIEPLWGIRIDPEHPDEHVELVNFRKPSKEAFNRLWSMIQGKPVGRTEYN
ncbi:MAG: metal-dependent hydrolase [Verrucomicrobiota bacterium]